MRDEFWGVSAALVVAGDELAWQLYQLDCRLPNLGLQKDKASIDALRYGGDPFLCWPVSITLGYFPCERCETGPVICRIGK